MLSISKIIRSHRLLVLGLLATLGLLLALPTIVGAQTVPGFTVTPFATGITGARQVSIDPTGNEYTMGRDT